MSRKSRNVADLTFGVKRSDGYISSTWRLWVTKKGDVYLTTKDSLGRVHKYSIHRSGICMAAFRTEHPEGKNVGDRAGNRWKRADTPPKGQHRRLRPLCINIPTNYLSKPANNESLENVTWIDAAPEGSAVRISLGITY